MLKVQDATPAWDLPIFPFLLGGVIATVGATFEPSPATKMSMLVAGLFSEGLGFLLTILMFTIYVRRMIEHGPPGPPLRPVMFMSVGPPSFTTSSITGLAKASPVSAKADYFGNVQITRQVVMILATFMAIFVWSLRIWFFCISAAANVAAWKKQKQKFKLNWWSAYCYLSRAKLADVP